MMHPVLVFAYVCGFAALVIGAWLLWRLYLDQRADRLFWDTTEDDLYEVADGVWRETAAVTGESTADAGHHGASSPAGSSPAPLIAGPGSNPIRVTRSPYARRLVAPTSVDGRHGCDEYAAWHDHQPTHAAQWSPPESETERRRVARFDATEVWGPDTTEFAGLTERATGRRLTARGPREKQLRHTRSYTPPWSQDELPLRGATYEEVR